MKGNAHGNVVGDNSFFFQLELLEDVGLEDLAHFCKRVSYILEVDFARL